VGSPTTSGLPKKIQSQSSSPTPRATQDDPALTTLAERINAVHRRAHDAAQTAIEHATECGRLLIQAKAQVEHGGCLPWIKAKLSFGARQAYKYMRLAECAPELSNVHPNSHSIIDGTLVALAEPRTPPEPSADAWWSLPPDEKARCCQQWPDQRGGAVLYLHLSGDPVEVIAGERGLDIREVGASLFPDLAEIRVIGDVLDRGTRARRRETEMSTPALATRAPQEGSQGTKFLPTQAPGQVALLPSLTAIRATLVEQIRQKPADEPNYWTAADEARLVRRGRSRTAQKSLAMIDASSGTMPRALAVAPSTVSRWRAGSGLPTAKHWRHSV
jgi:hypothetical protein